MENTNPKQAKMLERIFEGIDEIKLSDQDQENELLLGTIDSKSLVRDGLKLLDELSGFRQTPQYNMHLPLAAAKQEDIEKDDIIESLKKGKKSKD